MSNTLTHRRRAALAPSDIAHSTFASAASHGRACGRDGLRADWLRVCSLPPSSEGGHRRRVAVSRRSPPALASRRRVVTLGNNLDHRQRHRLTIASRRASRRQRRPVLKHLPNLDRVTIASHGDDSDSRPTRALDPAFISFHNCGNGTRDHPCHASPSGTEP
jgi:hypothetical protein